jgi:hypothetical protein
MEGYIHARLANFSVWDTGNRYHRTCNISSRNVCLSLLVGDFDCRVVHMGGSSSYPAKSDEGKLSMRNLRVWRRLGAVLSVLWFIGFAGWIWTSTNEHVGDFYGNQLRACYRIMEYAIDDAVARRKSIYDPADDSKARADFDACDKEALRVFHIMHEETRAGFWLVILLDLASIALGWLVACVIVLTGRWVMAGAI